MLKPLDLLVGLKAHLWPDARPWSYERLAASLGISPSQAHTSVRRLEAGNLFRSSDRSLRVHTFVGFATHGVPVVFPAVPGDLVIGMPTAHSAPPLAERLVAAEAYVWPTGEGMSGRAIEPLHRAAPAAAAADDALYRALALVDALRVGRARDRKLAGEALERLLAAPARDERWLEARS